MQETLPKDGDNEDGGILLIGDPSLTAEILNQIEAAKQLAKDEKPLEAIEVCKALLQSGTLPVNFASKVFVILKALGQAETADRLHNSIVTQIRENLSRLKDPEKALLPAAEAMSELGEIEEAKALVQKAHDAAPSNQTIVSSVAALLVFMDDIASAKKVASDYLNQSAGDMDEALHFATVFSYLNCAEAMEAALEVAKARCKTSTQRARLDYFLSSNGLEKKALNQHGMAVELFDSFASSYDQQLDVLKNNGPSIVYSALEDLGLKKDKSRRVLDAGCGTGLCSTFLLQYAKELVGVDLSVAMLEKSRERNKYTFLARTDLSVSATYPEGKFDLIVCADVLVYFGALDTVFQNFFSILNPGGWLVATVENEDDPDVKAGFKLHTSGRHKHTDTYLVTTLRNVGFPKPKLLEHARLRNEFGKPVLGTVVAVQKPALLF